MGSSFSKQKHAKGAKAGGHAKAPKASKVPKRYKAPKASRAPRPSKPSKPFYPAKAPKTPNPPRKNIKPSPHKPLSYPTLATLPPRGRPIPHNPRTEEEAAKRYNAILAANPVFAGRQKAPSAPLPPVPQKAKTPKPKAKPQPQASFQFMPLSEIGALPKAKAKADGNSGYGLYPPAQKGDSRGECALSSFP